LSPDFSTVTSFTLKKKEDTECLSCVTYLIFIKTVVVAVAAAAVAVAAGGGGYRHLNLNLPVSGLTGPEVE
jgi:hypothetical protein